MPKTVRTFIRPHHRHSEATQRAGAAGDEVYVIGAGVTRADVFRSVRKGDEVEIEWAFLLAEPRSKTTLKPIDDFFKALAAIEQKAVVVEWGSGRLLRSNRKADRDAMVARAVEMIRNSGRSLAGTKGGRPRFTFKDETEREKARLLWVSRENVTDDDRVAAIKEAIGRSPGPTKLRQMFGSPLGNQRT